MGVQEDAHEDGAPPEISASTCGCNQGFLRRVKENNEKPKGSSPKHTPEGPKERQIVTAEQDEVSVLAPLPFIENYF